MISAQAIHELPTVRGVIERNAPLDKLTWFRVGGYADILFIPQDAEDLSSFLHQIPHDMPVTPLGVGSNMLIRDGGIEGAVIRFGKKFSTVTIKDNEIIAGAGAPDIAVSSAARDAGLSGLEFLRGIPGTIGGAVKMNAGAYGSEMSEILQWAEIMDRQGNCHKLSAEDLDFTYRHSSLDDDVFCLSVCLKGQSSDKKEIEQRMQEIVDARELSQPLRTRTGGSTFKNPDGQSAWLLIDQAGCRGLKIGDAMVSEKHCNFLINMGNATAQDIEDLGEEVRRRVRDHSGVDLIWEIRIIGRKISDRRVM
ncbi:MAG: UDP-N-acetylmuramate dehydrogenase [Emcibacter sp.]|nr:UDP-N-acetylmuramate dehydrogenase [Emcibacter sp.]